MSEWMVTVIGWRALFYLQGAVALVWCVLWQFLVAENPAKHPRITTQEKTHITSSIGAQHAWRGLPVPWPHIFRWVCKGVYVCVCVFGDEYLLRMYYHFLLLFLHLLIYFSAIRSSLFHFLLHPPRNKIPLIRHQQQ